MQNTHWYADHHLNTDQGRQVHVVDRATGAELILLGVSGQAPSDAILRVGGETQHMVLDEHGAIVAARRGDELYLFEYAETHLTIHSQLAPTEPWETTELTPEELADAYMTLLASSPTPTVKLAGKLASVAQASYDSSCDEIKSVALPTPVGASRGLLTNFLSAVGANTVQGAWGACDWFGAAVGAVTTGALVASGGGAFFAGFGGSFVGAGASVLCDAIVNPPAQSGATCEPLQQSHEDPYSILDHLDDLSAQERTETIVRNARRAVDDGSNPIAVLLGATIVHSSYEDSAGDSSEGSAEDSAPCPDGFERWDDEECLNDDGCPPDLPYLGPEGYCWTEASDMLDGLSPPEPDGSYIDDDASVTNTGVSPYGTLEIAVDSFDNTITRYTYDGDWHVGASGTVTYNVPAAAWEPPHIHAPRIVVELVSLASCHHPDNTYQDMIASSSALVVDLESTSGTIAYDLWTEELMYGDIGQCMAVYAHVMPSAYYSTTHDSQYLRPMVFSPWSHCATSDPIMIQPPVSSGTPGLCESCPDPSTPPSWYENVIRRREETW
ncbi:MAG: hypothetical protein GY842_27600 [bacterium]|nr:hypothetical protein [bacterium]